MGLMMSMGPLRGTSSEVGVRATEGSLGTCYFFVVSLSMCRVSSIQLPPRAIHMAILRQGQDGMNDECTLLRYPK